MLMAVAAFLAQPAEAATVRADRPRILLSNGAGPGTSAAEFRRRCTTDDAYQARCQGAIASGEGLYPAIALAAGYVVNDDAGACDAAYDALQSIGEVAPGDPDPHSFISNNGRNMAQLAIVRDWCDPALDDGQRGWLEDRIASWADWYVAAEGLDVYHDDMNNVWNAVALAALALSGTARDAQAQGWLAAAEAQWKDVILPALAYEADFWHEGFVYVQPAVGSAVFWAAAWTAATDEDAWAWTEANAGDVLEGYLDMHAYLMRPDYRYAYFGDTNDPKQSIELFSRWIVDAITSGTGSALGQGLSMEIRDNSRRYYDYAGADGWMPAIFYDAAADADAVPRTSLPTARWLSQGAADVAVLRSGWGPDDTFVAISCGDYFGAHQHLEVGGLHVFRHAMLTGPTGYYDSFDTDHWQNYYSQHSVHANTLAIERPGEFFPTLQSLGDVAANVNDGGQRGLRRDQNGAGYPSPDLDAYLANKTSGTMYETGTLETFESARCHDYVACDITAAYTSPGFETNGNDAKVTEVTRQVVFLRPEIVVVFDRVESTDAAFDKRFQLHVVGSEEVDGTSFTFTNGPGRLFGRTLLPSDAQVSVVSNFEVDGVSHAPFEAGAESGGTRLEVSPLSEAARDYFLHVLDATSSTTAEGAASSLVETDEVATATVEDAAGNSWIVDFVKNGAMGGHLLALGASGETICDQDLGEFASDADADTDGDTDSDTDTDTDSDADADGGAARDDGGCGCRTGGGRGSFLGLALLLAALFGRRRRA